MASKDRPRVFLDTNVLFSALHSRSGTPNRLVQWHVSGRLQIVISRLVLDELMGIVQEKLPRKLPDLLNLMADNPPDIYDDPPAEEAAAWTDLLDFKDAVILAAAVAAKPDYFVTGDKRFLNPTIAERSGLRIVTPARMLAHMQKR